MFVEGGGHTQYLELSSLLLRGQPWVLPSRAPLGSTPSENSSLFLDQGEWMNDADAELKSGRADEDAGQSRTEVDIPKGPGYSGLCSGGALTQQHSRVREDSLLETPGEVRGEHWLEPRQPAPCQNPGHVQGEVLQGHRARPCPHQP